MYFYLFFSYHVKVAAPYHVTFVRSFTKYIFLLTPGIGRSKYRNYSLFKLFDQFL